MAKKTDFNGLILYSIENDGCLNGVYTNRPSFGEIFNEIARRTNWHEGEPIVGIYICSYSEGNDIKTCELEIYTDDNKEEPKVYFFYWRKDKKEIFEGVGYKMNEKQIAVSYWEV